MKKFTLGKRYQLPHGTGTLVGIELLDPLRPGYMIKVMVGPMTGNAYTRYLFELDEGHTWAYDDSDLYAAWGDDIKRLR